MTAPRKHHYLPKFYLRGFSADGSSVYQVEKGGSRAFSCAIGDAAAIRDYHVIDDVEVPDAQAVEKALAAFEGELAKGLAEIQRSGIQSAESRALLVQFISLMRWRVPAAKGYFSSNLASVVKESGKILERQGKLPPPPKGYEDILKMENLKIEISNAEPLHHMFELATDPTMLNLLGAMRLSLLQAPFGSSFLTSDQPVALYFPSALPPGQGAGIADQSIEISIPLSSRVLVHLDWAKDRPRDSEIGSDDVAEFNRRTVVMARSWVFAPQESNAVFEFVQRFAHCSAGAEFETIAHEKGALLMNTFRPVLPIAAYAAK